MSVLYSVMPIDEEHWQQWNEYLAQFGARIPIGVASRYPLPSEIRQVLDEMTDYTKKYFITEKVWDVDIYETIFYDEEKHHSTGKHASINSIGPALNESSPLHIYFHSGTEEVNLEIVLRLSVFTGPLILMADDDIVPLIVADRQQLADLVNQWEKQRQIADSL